MADKPADKKHKNDPKAQDAITQFIEACLFERGGSLDMTDKLQAVCNLPNGTKIQGPKL